MSAFTAKRFARFGPRPAFAAALIALLAVTPSAWAQPAPAPAAPVPELAQQPAPVPPPPPPPPRENPGLVNEIGKLLKNPSSLLPDISMPQWSTEQARPEQPAKPEAQRPAATGAPETPSAAPQPQPPASPPPAVPAPPAPSRLGIPTMVTGRTVCPDSPSGGPDCKAAADTLCKGKGYREGKSLGTDAAEKCSAKVLIPGRPRQPGDCRTESFVTSAWCQ